MRWLPEDELGKMIMMSLDARNALNPNLIGYRVVNFNPETDTYGSFYGHGGAYYGGIPFNPEEKTYTWYTIGEDGKPTVAVPDEIKAEIWRNGGSYNDLEKYGYKKVESVDDIPDYDAETDLVSLIRENYDKLPDDLKEQLKKGTAHEGGYSNDAMMALIDNGGYEQHPLTGNKRGLYVAPDLLSQLFANGSKHFAYSFWGLADYLAAILTDRDANVFANMKNFGKGSGGFGGNDTVVRLVPELVSKDYALGRGNILQHLVGEPSALDKSVLDGSFRKHRLGKNRRRGNDALYELDRGIVDGIVERLADEGIVNGKEDKELLKRLISNHRMSYIPSKATGVEGGMFNPDFAEVFDAFKEDNSTRRRRWHGYDEPEREERVFDKLSTRKRHEIWDRFMREILLRRIARTFGGRVNDPDYEDHSVLVQVVSPWSSLVPNDAVYKVSPQTDGMNELRGLVATMSRPIATRNEFFDDVDKYHELLDKGASPSDAWAEALPEKRYGKPSDLGSDERIKRVYKELCDDADRIVRRSSILHGLRRGPGNG